MPAQHACLSGAEIIIRFLERAGVECVAGIPGGALLPLYEALGDSRIRHVLARHEQAAGFIAQGMARTSGRAGVCFATSGPGVTNIVTALADAKLDSIALVCIAGQVPRHLIGTDAFQEVATVAMVKPVVKAAFFANDASELAPLLARAFELAESGRPGPVLIDVPKDVQVQRIPVAWEALQSVRPADNTKTVPQDLAGKYQEAAAMISAAHRPVLYVGGGVVKAGAHRQLRRFAQDHAIPVASTLMALGSMPPGHELNLGMLGMHGARFTNLVLDESDLVIAIGARFDDRATGCPKRFAQRAQIIHIDADARELGKIKQPTLAIHADAAHALSALQALVKPLKRGIWQSRVAELRTSYPLQMPQGDDPCSPYGIVRAVGRLASENAIITTDVGQHQMWVAQAFPFTRPDRWLTSGGLGTMGFGLPAAIGAALADPDATTICFTGDGSLLMNVQELATLAELDLDIKIILLDNAALGLVRQQQELFYQRRLVASHFSRPSDFVAIARAFGIEAVELGSDEDALGCLAAAFGKRGPMLVRVPIAAAHHVLPMVKPGAANTEALDHAPA